MVYLIHVCYCAFVSETYNIHIYYTYTLVVLFFYCLCCTFTLGGAPVSQWGQNDQPRQCKLEIILSFICPAVIINKIVIKQSVLTWAYALSKKVAYYTLCFVYNLINMMSYNRLGMNFSLLTSMRSKPYIAGEGFGLVPCIQRFLQIVWIL